MTIGIWILLIILFAAALFGTIFAFKQEENKMKKYEEEGDTIEDELRRSHEYETSSLKTNIPIMSGIYLVTIIVSVIVFLVYIN